MLRSLLQDDVGEGMLCLVRDLFPITRSITGDGLRETLRQIADYIPLALHEVPTGTPVLDWNVPREWNIRAGRIETLSGRVLIDFAENNLCVVGYSLPIDRIVSREELAQHVHTLPDQPHLIPYRTGYYAESWGFCIAHAEWATMNEEAYRAVIDSSLEPGSLTYGEAHFPGECEDEVLLSVHCCHPSLANDNLSGVAVAVALAQCISLSNRFLSTASFSFRRRLDPSPGCREMRRPCGASATDWFSHALATLAHFITRKPPRDCRCGSRRRASAQGARSAPSAPPVQPLRVRRAAVLLTGL